MDNKTFYALGYFDGVHLGHRALLEESRTLAACRGCQWGVVTFFGHPEAITRGCAPALINTAEDRQRLLEQLGAGRITALHFDQALQQMSWRDFLDMLVMNHGAAGFVCGTDFHFGHLGQGTAPLLQQYCSDNGLCCRLVEQQYLDGIRISSTHIRALLKEGKIREANRFLGHSHILSGSVQKGQQLGRTIGFPTANLPYPAGVLPLPKGVYACRVAIEGKSYNAVTNIGTRPTVSGTGITVEAHLLDFSGELYGKLLTLEFLDFIRPEQKFDSLADLQKQIAQDLQYFA